MTIMDAYIKAKEKSDKKILSECFDTAEAWVFMFRSSLIFHDPVIVGGIGFYTVNKNNGNVMGCPSNPNFMELIWNGIAIDTKQFRAEERKGLFGIEKVVSKVLYP